MITSVPLSLEGVTVTYPPQTRRAQPVQALSDVSLSLAPGVITGLAGPNGAGKTTLIEICIGALAATHGLVRWFGDRECGDSVRRSIGLCPDVPALPRRLTGRELLELFAALDGMSRSHAADRIRHLSGRLRLDEAMNQRSDLMSRGTALRFGVAQALLREPAIVLCDESFGPLDPVAQTDLRRLLREEAERGAAVLVSSHQLDQLGKVADDIIILSHGRVVRHLSPGAASARHVLVFDISLLDFGQRELAMAHFSDCWVVASEMRVPWTSGSVDPAALRNSLPTELSGLRVVGLENLSLEDLFLETLAPVSVK